MAKNETAKGASASATLREQMSKYAGPLDGTVVRFEYTFDNKDVRDDYGKKVKRRYYIYLALWVEDADKWYLTGVSGALPREMKNTDFMIMLAGEKVRSAAVATTFEGFKP